MKKSLVCMYLVFIGFSPLVVQAELKITAEKAKSEMPAKGGWTEVAAGNSKGQTVVLGKTEKFTELVLSVGQVTAAKDLILEVHNAKNGFPMGDKPFYRDTGSLPADLKSGAALRIALPSPLELSAGEWALVLRSEASKLRFSLVTSGYPKGRLIRQKNTEKWVGGAGKESDLLFMLPGMDIAMELAAPAKKPTAKKGKPAPAPRDVVINKSVTTNVTPLCERLPARPNVVVCMVDDLGWNQISVSQSTMGTARKNYATPNLEMLANQGLSFTHAYAQPNCAPTRAAMLSGQYPARIHNDVYVVNSLNRNGGGGISKAAAKFVGPKQTEDVAAEAITVAEALKQNGYATGHIGKYHVGGHDGEATLPENVGFDINIGGYTQGHQSTCFSTERNGEWVFKGLGRGHFDRFGAPYTEAYVAKYGFPASLVGTPKHVSDALGDAMEETVNKLHATDKPFYLQLHPYAVHGPVRARPDLLAAAGGDQLGGFIASIDLTIGRLLKVLEDPNQDGDTADSIAANTLILFTSDNGGTHGDNQPLRGKKGMFTEGGIRVPLIAYWPGVIPANTITDHLVHTVDYYPTLLELAGNKWMPPEAEHPLDGVSFAELLRRPDAERSRDPIFYLFPGYMDVRAQPCVVTLANAGGKRYKLLYFYEADAWELYNISDDIGEATNLISTMPELAAGLAKEMRAWLEQSHPTWQPKYPLVKKTGEPAGPPPLFK